MFLALFTIIRQRRKWRCATKHASLLQELYRSCPRRDGPPDIVDGCNCHSNSDQGLFSSRKYRKTFAVAMRLHHSQDGSIYTRYKLMCLVDFSFFREEQNAPAFNRDTWYHLTLCLQMIPPHFVISWSVFFTDKHAQSSLCLKSKSVAPLLEPEL